MPAEWMLKRGVDQREVKDAQINVEVVMAVADILQGVIIFFVLGSEFFVRYRFVRVAGVDRKEAAK